MTENTILFASSITFFPIFSLRYGIYGGAFDPIHLGHLLLAESCLRQAELDRVVFVPTGVSPHRSGKDSYRASAEDRFNMVESAISGCDEFLVSRFELDRCEPSYTIDTLHHFRHRFQKTFLPIEPKLFLLMGTDMLNDLPNWRKADEICRLATPLIVARAGWTLPDVEVLRGIVSTERLLEIKSSTVPMPQIELSSTQIRQRVAEGRSIRFQVPRNVEHYIAEHGLYRPATDDDVKSDKFSQTFSEAACQRPENT